MSDVDKARDRILDDYREDVYNNGLAFMDKEDVRDLCKEILADALVVVEELDKLRQEAKKRDLALVSLAEHARSEGIYNQLYNGLELKNHPDDFDDL